MSSNKTEHYGLHSWEAGDDFLRSEFNENFGRLDEVVGELVVTGSYEGDGVESRTIQLGFTPRALFLITSGADIKVNSTYYGGLAFPGQPSTAITIIEGGFAVRDDVVSNVIYSTNRANRTYYYMALK